MPDPLLARLVADPAPPPFAVLRREDGPGVEVLVGDRFRKLVKAPQVIRATRSGSGC